MIHLLSMFVAGWLLVSSPERRLRELYRVHPDPAREWPVYC
jgi:hypothetical protein